MFDTSTPLKITKYMNTVPSILKAEVENAKRSKKCKNPTP